ncbi:fungal specific transcription factor domain-containing protein [Seiridium cupressi]
MSRVAATVSTSSSEKNASSAPSSGPKMRSCVVCRNRKVRCDKLSPCSNCRRANIACVFPGPLSGRPPRWARRLDRATNYSTPSGVPAPHGIETAPEKVMDRLRSLETLVKELRGQVEQEQARAAAVSDRDEVSREGTLDEREPGFQRDTNPAEEISSVQKKFGRLVVQDSNRNRYISSGFWSQVSDELDGLEVHSRNLAGELSDSSEEEGSSERSLPTTMRHGFLFGHQLRPSVPDLHELHPLPSQTPFLLNVFSENVNFIIQAVHMPTIVNMSRNLHRDNTTHLTIAEEALLFSMYYAAIASMEEDDVSFHWLIQSGDSSPLLSSQLTYFFRYRIGLECALAKADFLNRPDIVLVQAFGIFLCLLRRHDSPRYVWMMTGLLIRMAQYLGLQRDGAQLGHLTPYEVEVRRKVWWGICLLDLRASEDQGTDLTIASGSFDTRIPSNFNDEDISPDSKQMPQERDGVTDATFARINAGTSEIVKQMMTRGLMDGVAGFEAQNRLLNDIYRQYEREYLQYASESTSILCWVAVTIARLVMAKMTLIVFMPAVFSSGKDDITDELRTKFLISAIEVAEYNHELNSEPACRQWRWVFQTYTHWYAIVYLLIEITRRPWSPIAERGWIALHSRWLIPAQTDLDKTLRIWVPLKKLMYKARKHRDAEVERLRTDRRVAARLELENQDVALPSSSGPFPPSSSVDHFRQIWRQLVGLSDQPGSETQRSGILSTAPTEPLAYIPYESQLPAKSSSTRDTGGLSSNMPSEPAGPGASAKQVTTSSANETSMNPTVNLPQASLVALPPEWSEGGVNEPGFAPWLWGDFDPSVNLFSNLDVVLAGNDMDLDSETMWYNWVQTATGMEKDART